MAEEAADRLERTEEELALQMSADISQRVSGLFKAKTGQDEMTESEFISMLPDVPPETVTFLFRLFDKDHSGKVGSREFLLAMGLLLKQSDSISDQIDACFNMFDVDCTGSLSKAEFNNMIRASVNINLGFLLQTTEGQDSMTEQLEKEYSQENIKFWKVSRAFRDLPAALRAAEAQEIFDTYIVPGAEQQVNIPGTMISKLKDAVATMKSSGEPPPADMFAPAEKEIFKLMERDTYTRFKQDPEMISRLCEVFFDAADGNHDGHVNFSEYSDFVHREPQAAAPRLARPLPSRRHAPAPAASSIHVCSRASRRAGPRVLHAAQGRGQRGDRIAASRHLQHALRMLTRLLRARR